MFHIVDVDNTLVFTNQLNTAGYVYALVQVGLENHVLIYRTALRGMWCVAGIQSLQTKN